MAERKDASNSAETSARHEALSASTLPTSGVNAPQATFQVTTLADVVDAGDGVLSLREAIVETNNLAGADIITFADGLRGGTIRLSSDLPKIIDDLTIDGDQGNSGANGIIISGESGPAKEDGFSAIALAGVSARLEDLTITGAAYQGVAATDADVAIARLRIQNIDDGATFGHGIEVNGGTLAVEDSVIGYTGLPVDAVGIKLSDGAEVSVLRSTIVGSAGEYGAGIDGAGRVTVIDSTIADNLGAENGFGISLTGDLIIENSTLSGNGTRDGVVGGAVRIDGTMALINSTIVNSVSDEAPGFSIGAVKVLSGSEATITNSTISGTTEGMGSSAEESLPGTGIYAATDSTVRIANSIVDDRVVGDIISNGANTFRDPNVAGATPTDSLGVTANQLFVETEEIGDSGTLRGVAADNVGPTETIALNDDPTNPALNSANPADAPETDQRGFQRDATPDIGSFEFGDLDDFVERSIDSITGDGRSSFESLIEQGILTPSGSGVPVAEGLAVAPPPTPSSRVYDIFVESGLQGEIATSLGRYVGDLESEGYSVTVQEFAGTAEQLRATLQDRWTDADLEGALLIGDLPTRTFKSVDNFGSDSTLREYVHDLYFMDLDGEYIFNDHGPDAHVAGTGDVGPEIYVSRLLPSTVENITGVSESAAINDFLGKSHAVRHGDITFEDKAIAFLDDDWSGLNAETFLSPLYADIEVINDVADTTAATYLEVLGDDAETLVETIHSGPTTHYVTQSGSGIISNEDIAAANPQVGFINMFNCSSGDFTAPGNLIGTYTFASDRTINAVASTKTGSMLRFEQFYGPLADGINMGQAFKLWFDANAAATDDPNQDWQVDWFYGMTMHGDPTLAPTLRPGVDLVEPNDTLADATDISDLLQNADDGRVSLTGIIGDNPRLAEDALDVDLVRFDLLADQFLVVDTDAGGAGGSSLDTVLTLFDADGNLIDSDDDGGPGTDSLVGFDSGQGGSFAVGVSSYGNFNYDPTSEGSGGNAFSSGNYVLNLAVIEDFLPDLTEGVRVAEEDINGVDRSQMLIGETRDAAISFVDEFAANQNSLGVYLIAEDGTISHPRWVFERIEHSQTSDLVASRAVRPGSGPLDPGDTVYLSELFDPADLQPGTEFGLFLVGNGAAENPFVVYDGGTLAFRSDGQPAEITDTVPQLLHTTETGATRVVEGDIMHTVDGGSINPLSNTLNPPPLPGRPISGRGQALSGILDGEFVIAFEDVPLTSGDGDFNDLLVAVDTGDGPSPLGNAQGLVADGGASATPEVEKLVMATDVA